MRLAALMSRLIPPYAPADGPPPQSFWRFARWALSGSWRATLGATVIIALAATMEVATAWYTGWAIDIAEAEGIGAFWSAFWPVVLYECTAWY